MSTSASKRPYISTSGNNSSGLSATEIRDTLKALNTRDNFLKLKRCVEMAKGKEYLVLRMDKKNVHHGGKRVTIVCQEDDNSEEDIWMLFLSPSYCEPRKYAALEKLLNKSKPFSLYVSLEDIVEDKDLTIPIYNFLLKNNATSERIVVPCNFYPNSTAVQEERVLIQREMELMKNAEAAAIANLIPEKTVLADVDLNRVSNE